MKFNNFCDLIITLPEIDMLDFYSVVEVFLSQYGIHSSLLLIVFEKTNIISILFLKIMMFIAVRPFRLLLKETELNVGNLEEK